MLFELSLVHALKHQFNELINEKSQTNTDQKSIIIFCFITDQNLLFLQ